jgi:hypothetical protein|tara:strand:- start:221 stop:1297 length:1077 start_codon:yes stop_codon:yes gene_type:complete
MSQTKVAAPFVENNLTFRNTIINGDMRVAQRQTSSTGLTSSTTAPGVDRFNLTISGLGTWTVQQSTDVPTGEGFSNSLKFDNTTADASPASGDFAMCQYKYEGLHLQGFNKGTASAKKFAVSFYVKSSKTGTHIVSLSDQDNSRQVSQAYTVDSADTWEHKKMIFPADTTGTFDNDNAFSMQIFWWLGAGSDRTSGTLNTSWGSITNANRAVGQVNLADNTSNNWYITGVQVEVGDQCSEFEHLPFEVQEQRCQRYCMVYGNGQNFSGGYYNASSYVCEIYFPTKMRAAPSVSCTDISNSIRVYTNGGIDYLDTLGDNGDTVYQSQLYNNGDASATSGHRGAANINDGNFKLTYSSEL